MSFVYDCAESRSDLLVLDAASLDNPRHPCTCPSGCRSASTATGSPPPDSRPAVTPISPGGTAALRLPGPASTTPLTHVPAPFHRQGQINNKDVTMTKATPMTAKPALQALDHLDESLTTLPERWLPRAQELREWTPRWFEAWNSHDLDALESLVTQDFTWNDPAMFGHPVHGRAEFRAFNAVFFRAFPDVRFNVLGTPSFDLDGHELAIRWRMTATLTGELTVWGQHDGPRPRTFAPTHREIDIEGADFYQVHDALLHRWTNLYDLFEVLRQAGLAPSPHSAMLRPALSLQRLATTIIGRVAPTV